MTSAVLLQAPEVRWQCPSCGLQDVTHEARPHSRMHSCQALGGLTTPMVQVHGLEMRKHQARHVVVERGDYVGDEQGLAEVNGKVVMAVHTEREDGSHDCTVYAPVARVTQEEIQEAKGR